MKQLPLISIITLTYKKFDTIFNTIESVLEQDYPNIEYIIADDGSDNFPKDEIEKFIFNNKSRNLKNVLITYNKENRGTVKNVNEAYKMAKGKYLLPLSGDDVFLNKNVVSKIVEIFNKRKCKVLVTSRMVCNNNLEPLYILPHIKERKILSQYNTSQKQYEALITEQFFDMASGCVMYIDKHFLEQWNYFDEEYYLWEDGPFLTKYTLSYKLEFAYDLISIRYQIGGVSNGALNPFMKSDIIKYNKTDRIEHLNKLDWFTVQKINYINKKNELSNNNDIIKLNLRYPLVILSKLIYKLRRKIYIKEDLVFIKGEMNASN